MKLWLLRPNEQIDPNNDPFNDWDTVQGFIIAATSEHDARRLAQDEGGDEVNVWTDGAPNSIDTWLDSRVSTCVELVPGTEATVIMRDFRAG